MNILQASGERHVRGPVQCRHTQPQVTRVQDRQSEPRVREGVMGGATKRTGLSAQSQSRAREHTERQASAQEHDQLIVRSAYW